MIDAYKVLKALEDNLDISNKETGQIVFGSMQELHNLVYKSLTEAAKPEVPISSRDSVTMEDVKQELSASLSYEIDIKYLLHIQKHFGHYMHAEIKIEGINGYIRKGADAAYTWDYNSSKDKIVLTVYGHAGFTHLYCQMASLMEWAIAELPFTRTQLCFDNEGEVAAFRNLDEAYIYCAYHNYEVPDGFKSTASMIYVQLYFDTLLAEQVNVAVAQAVYLHEKQLEASEPLKD